MEDDLVKVLEKIIAENFSEEKLMLLLVKKKIKESGIELTRNQEKRLISIFRRQGLNEFSLKPTRQQKVQLKTLGKENLILDFTENDLVAFQNEINNLSADLGVETAKWLTDKLLQDWKKQSGSVLRRIKKIRHDFVASHNRTWNTAFDLLEALISLCLEMGDEFRQRFSSDKKGEGDVVFYALERLHARGCQVSSEILSLLRSGFADGAHARWRTLHEISVVALFISSRDSQLAERYLAHSAIGEYQRALQYRKHSETLSYAPMSDDDFEQIKSNFEVVKEKYKDEFDSPDWFRNDYWWASQVLNNQRPNFALIEERVGVSFMQPFVKLAHLNVHAGSEGVFVRLGSPPDNKDLLLAGASTFGVAEPGQNTAYTIYTLTYALISYNNRNLDNFSLLHALEKLMEEVMWEFDRIMEKQVNKK